MFSSPCFNCGNHGVVYSEENCKNCDYSNAVKILKRVLLAYDQCYTHCKHSLGFDEFQCGICNHESCGECVARSKYEIDFNKVKKDYKIE